MGTTALEQGTTMILTGVCVECSWLVLGWVSVSGITDHHTGLPDRTVPDQYALDFRHVRFTAFTGDTVTVTADGRRRFQWQTAATGRQGGRTQYDLGWHDVVLRIVIALKAGDVSAIQHEDLMRWMVGSSMPPQPDTVRHCLYDWIYTWWLQLRHDVCNIQKTT